MGGMRRIAIVVCTAALSLASCSDASPREAAGSASPTAPSPEPAASSADPAVTASATPTGPERSSPAPSVVASGVGVPAAGTYLYAQSGSERFCSETACGTPRPLPSTADAILTRPGAGAHGEQVAIELRVDTGRIVRLALSFTGDAAVLERLDAEFTESGVTQTATLQPIPPARLLDFPLRAGKTWSGAFDDQGARGTYSFRARARETINAAGEQVAAWRVEGSIDVEGETSGHTELTMWIEPATNTILRLKAILEARSALARYEATLNETLSRRPASPGS